MLYFLLCKLEPHGGKVLTCQVQVFQHLRVSKSTCCEATWKPSRGRFMYKKSVWVHFPIIFLMSLCCLELASDDIPFELNLHVWWIFMDFPICSYDFPTNHLWPRCQSLHCRPVGALCWLHWLIFLATEDDVIRLQYSLHVYCLLWLIYVDMA